METTVIASAATSKGFGIVVGQYTYNPDVFFVGRHDAKGKYVVLSRHNSESAARAVANRKWKSEK